MKALQMAGKKTRSLEYVLFDWDGTLLNSFDADANAYMHMFAALGMPWSIAELKRHYSPNWHRVYRAAGLPRAKWEEADRLWRRFYDQQEPRMQPGALRVLRDAGSAIQAGAGVQRKPLARAKAAEGARTFRRCFSRKFAARTLHGGNRIRRRCAWRSKSCAPRRKSSVYIGDAPEDIEMAHRAGMRAIGVLGGSPVPERLRAAAAGRADRNDSSNCRRC